MLKGIVYCNIPEIVFMGFLTSLILISILYFYNYYYDKFHHTGCFIWYGAHDNRTKEVDCSLITEDFCKSINCTFTKWSCGAPTCICG
jgi:hypothetical protein